MAKLSMDDIVGKSIKVKSQYLDSIDTDKHLENGKILGFKGYFNGLVAQGEIYDKAAMFNKPAGSNDYKVRVNLIQVNDNNVPVKTILEDIRKTEEGTKYVSVSEFMDSAYFSLQANKEGNIVSIDSLEIGDLKVNMPAVKSMLENSINNLLYERKISRGKMIDSTSVSPLAKPKSNTAILATYDAITSDEILEEEAPYVNMNPQSRGSVEEHIRSAQKRVYKKRDQVHEIGIAPYVVHVNMYSKNALKEEFFAPDGKPTIEAVFKYRGNLTDKELHKIVEVNKFKSMAEVYGKD